MATATPVDLVFCMAGLYQRFRDAGYTTPKYLLPWRGRSVLAHILAHIVPHAVFERVVLIANQRDEAHADAILAATADFGLTPGDLHFIGDTDGQATTARIGVECLGTSDRPVAFHNVDTLISARNWALLAEVLSDCAGCIDVFPADEPCFSYVAVDEQDLVLDMQEKVVISPHATSGFYAFHSAAAFVDDCRSCQQSRGERYISDVYRRMLARGERLGILRGRRDKTLIFGTPAQYEALVADARQTP